MLLSEPRAETRELPRRLLRGGPGREPRDRFHEVRAAAVLRQIPVQPQPHVDIVGKREARRHHAGNDVAAVLQVERLADDGRIAGVTAPPEPIADDRNVVARVERAIPRKSRAHFRRHAEQLKQIRARFDRADAHRVHPRIGERELGAPPGRRIREHRGDAAVIHEVHRRETLSRQRLLGIRLPQRDELLRLPEGQRPEKHRIGDAEDCGRGARAEAERDDHDGGE